MSASTAIRAPGSAATYTLAGPQGGMVATLHAIQGVLADFPQHELADAGRPSLMNRVDTKYLVPAEQLAGLLDTIRTQYSVLSVAGGRVLHYRTDYYDTEDFRFYHEHHNGKSRRCKVRCRHYVDSGGLFLELKARESSGRTVKNRIRLSMHDRDGPWTEALHEGLCRLGLDNASLERRVRIEYLRIALQGLDRDERVSIDLGMQGMRVNEGKCFSLPGLAIVELKQGRMDRQSPLFRALRRLHINPVSFSKYCVTCALLYQGQLKVNRFKPLLARIGGHLALSS